MPLFHWRLRWIRWILKPVSTIDAAASRIFASYRIPNIIQVVWSLQQPRKVPTQWYEYQKKMPRNYYNERYSVEQSWSVRISLYLCAHYGLVFFSHFMLHRRELIPHDKLLHLTQCYAMFLRILWTAKQWRHTCQCRCELHMFSLCSKLTFVLAIVHRFSLNRKYRNISRYVSATVRNSFEFSPL